MTTIISFSTFFCKQQQIYPPTLSIPPGDAVSLWLTFLWPFWPLKNCLCERRTQGKLLTNCSQTKGRTKNPLSEHDLKDLCRKLDVAANSWSHAGNVRWCKVHLSSAQKSYCWVTTSASNQETLNSNLEQWLQEAVSMFLMAQTQDPKSWYQRWATLSGWIKRPSRPGWHEEVLTQKRGAGRIKRRSGCSSYRSWSLSVRGDVMENDFQAASKSL